MIDKVAVLGLGTMGGAMAERLHAAGLEVWVWNRTASRADPFRGRGFHVADSAADAVAAVDAVVTMLFDADAVRSVMTQALPAHGDGLIWMQSSTVGTLAAREFATMAEQAGVGFVDAPMLGTKSPARAGTLTALVAGAAPDIESLQPVLDAVSSRIVRVGDAAPAASALKLAANAWIATITAGICQSLTIAERLGVEPGLLLRALDGTGPDSPYAQLKGREVLARRFDPQFEVEGILKDVRLAREETPRISHTLLDALDELYSDAVEAGLGREDIAAVWSAFQREER